MTKYLELAKECGFKTNRHGEVFPAGDAILDHPITNELNTYAARMRQEAQAESQAVIEQMREALKSVDGQLEVGFVRCSLCGEQEDTKDFDCRTEIKAALALKADSSALDAIRKQYEDRVEMLVEALKQLEGRGTNLRLPFYKIISDALSATSEQVRERAERREAEVRRKALEEAAELCDMFESGAGKDYAREIRRMEGRSRLRKHGAESDQ